MTSIHEHIPAYATAFSLTSLTSLTSPLASWPGQAVDVDGGRLHGTQRGAFAAGGAAPLRIERRC